MFTRTLVSEEEYLHTSYDPECEYRDGELIERTGGTISHSSLMVLLTTYLWRRRKLWNIHPYIAVHTRLREGRYIIPDIAVISGPDPSGDFITEPPLICIEILDPEDKPLPVNRRVREILEFGVPYVWLIEAETLESEVHTQQGSTILADGIFRIPGTLIEVPLQALEED